LLKKLTTIDITFFSFIQGGLRVLTDGRFAGNVKLKMPSRSASASSRSAQTLLPR